VGSCNIKIAISSTRMIVPVAFLSDPWGVATGEGELF